VTGRRRGDKGAAVVDFVLVMLLLVPLVLGILQLALVLHVRNTLASAAGEGARFAAVAGSSPELGEAKAREQVRAALGPRFARGIDVAPASVGGAAGYRARIVADVPVLGIAGRLVTVTVTGHAVAEQQ
jgi:Flp pilus assembly protein TadG